MCFEMSSIQKANSKHLWWMLLGLGFQPEAAAASAGISRANVRHINLGMNMFDKPNKDAFYVVTYFLLEKLNSPRVHELFRYCWPVLDRKADAEFRKVTFAWLRDIAAEYSNAFPKVVASLFLSPGGPKFITLMLHLAKHVMLKDMSTFPTGDSWVPEAAAAKAQSVETAIRRFHLVRSRFLKAAVEQDLFMQDYQCRAQLLIKSIRDLRAEEVKYDNLLKRYEQESNNERVLREKIVQVRSLWADVDKMLSALEEERAVLASVIGGHVDQYVLDGTDHTVKIPTLLRLRVEDSCQVSGAGNVYEAGHLNVLRLLELLKEALLLLEEERAKVGQPALTFDLQRMEEQALLLGRALDGLRLTGRKLSKEEIPEVKGFIQKIEEVWEKKWADGSSRTRLRPFLSEDPALEFLPPMAPLSFEPATEASFRSCIFSQFPAKLPDELSMERPEGGDQARVMGVSTKDAVPQSSQPAEGLRSETPTSGSECSRPSTPNGASPSSSTSGKSASPEPVSVQHTFTAPMDQQASVVKHRSVSSTQPRFTGAQKKASILDQEYNNLADQFAEAVTGGSADGSREALDLEQLLCALSDPFSTRKQLPRTPESLISDVKNSWRQALAEGEAEKARLSERFAECLVSEPPAGPENQEEACSGAAPSQLDPGSERSLDNPLLQTWESLHSTLPWESNQVDAACTQNSSDIVQVGIASETMPDLLGSESLLSSSDEAPEEEEKFILPQLSSDGLDLEWEQQSTSSRFHKVQEAYSEGSFLCSAQTASALPHSRVDTSLGGTGWEDEGKVFCLELDTLELASPSDKGNISLPKLITFSPMDDLKP